MKSAELRREKANRKNSEISPLDFCFSDAADQLFWIVWARTCAVARDDQSADESVIVTTEKTSVAFLESLDLVSQAGIFSTV